MVSKIRGKSRTPSFGLQVFITAANEKYKDGKVKVVVVNHILSLLNFQKMEEMNRFMSCGNSEKEESTHFDDQMNVFKFQNKKMTLIGDKIYNDSERIYNPR